MNNDGITNTDFALGIMIIERVEQFNKFHDEKIKINALRQNIKSC